jgi:GTPase SAR1 family protein
VDDRDVSQKEGSEMAKSLNAPYLEVSARTRVNVEECFKLLVREMRKTKEKGAATESVPEFRIGQKNSNDKEKPQCKCLLQ